jgi:GntR family transcriptional regulator / MocR family aminotransferase
MNTDFDALRDFSFSSSKEPLHHQLYQALKDRILDGRITPGGRIPSSRSLSHQLGASRNTINSALEQLKAEGYVKTKPGAGHFISDELPDSYMTAISNTSKRAFPQSLDMPLSETGKRLAGRENIRKYHNTSFEAGMPDLTAFPIKKWGQIYHRQSQRKSLLGYDSLQGYAHLREVLANYLRSSRGLVCRPEQVIITSGAQHAANIAISVTLNPGDEVYLENPGYIGMREAFKRHGCQLTGISVSQDGVNPNSLPKKPKGKLLCLTPTHQYPMGGILPLANRLRILEWAAENKVWILEDDYDSEYHYDHKPIAAMQGLGLPEQVIYIGSFSKVLYPGLRLGYMVVPDNLVGACVKVKNQMTGQTPLVEQATVAEFIAEGHFTSHLRKMREHYHLKFKAMIEACHTHLPDLARLQYTGAGMHIVLIFKTDTNHSFNDKEVVLLLSKQDIYASPLSNYYIGNEKQHGLVLGFANTEADKIDAYIQEIKRTLLTYI